MNHEFKNRIRIYIATISVSLHQELEKKKIILYLFSIFDTIFLIKMPGSQIKHNIVSQLIPHCTKTSHQQKENLNI